MDIREKRVYVTKASAEFRRLVASANRRGVPMKLKQSDFDAITKSECFYCGSDENLSVDRHLPAKPYSVKNCFGACKQCLAAKQGMGRNEYLLLCKSVYEHRFQPKEIQPAEPGSDADENFRPRSKNKPVLKSAKEVMNEYEGVDEQEAKAIADMVFDHEQEFPYKSTKAKKKKKDTRHPAGHIMKFDELEDEPEETPKRPKSLEQRREEYQKAYMKEWGIDDPSECEDMRWPPELRER